MRTNLGRTVAINLLLLSFTLGFLVNMADIQGSSMELHGKQIDIHSPEVLMDDSQIKLEIGNDDNRDQKTVGVDITDIEIIPLVNGRVYPNTYVTIRLISKGQMPTTVKLYPDISSLDSSITYSSNTGKFSFSERMEERAELDDDSSGLSFNSTSGDWETDFRLKFDWDFTDKISVDMRGELMGDAYTYDSHLCESAFIFERTIMISGEPIISTINPSHMDEQGYVKGGEMVLLKGLMVHFKGTNKIAPDIDDISVGVEDNNGRIWIYCPEGRRDLLRITYSFPLPCDEGTWTYRFTIFERPVYSNIIGEPVFSLKIDSTPPVLGNFRYLDQDEKTLLTWTYYDNGSGIDIESMTFTLKTLQGNMVFENRKFEVDVKGQDLMIGLEGMDENDYQIIPEVSDEVDNHLVPAKGFFFTTDPIHLHDVSIDHSITVYPEKIIENREVYFTANIRNLGTEDENLVEVDVLLEDNLFKRFRLENLHAGGNTQIIWDWVAGSGRSEFRVIVDPNGIIQDEELANNNARINVESDYLDLTSREDELIIDGEFDNSGFVRLEFEIRCIGTIGTGPIKVNFQEDEEFKGLHQIKGLEPGETEILYIDWMVDRSIERISIMIDPYNEIIESVEYNNRITFSNPYHTEEASTEEEQAVEKTAPLQDEEKEEKTDVVVQEHVGVTTWTETNLDAVDDDLPMTEKGPPAGQDGEPKPWYDENPLTLVAVLTAIGIIGLIGGIFGLSRETLRYRMLILFIPLYSKLKKEKIEQGIRYEILGYLKAKPGANYSELKNNLDLNDGSLVHHLKILEREEKIYSKKLGKYKLFYISTYRRQPNIGIYLSPFHKRILEIITTQPGIVPKKLSKILDRSQSDISYHLSELTRNGFLEKRKKGRNIHYYLKDEFMEMLDSI